MGSDYPACRTGTTALGRPVAESRPKAVRGEAVAIPRNVISNAICESGLPARAPPNTCSPSRGRVSRISSARLDSGTRCVRAH
jgi:hypothetical protein